MVQEDIEKDKEKAPSLTTTKGKEHTKQFKDIITENEDLDNGEIFDIGTGKILREF